MSRQGHKARRKDILVAFRMDADTYEYVATVAEHTGMSKSAVIRESVRGIRKLVFTHLLAKQRKVAD